MRAAGSLPVVLVLAVVVVAQEAPRPAAEILADLSDPAYQVRRKAVLAVEGRGEPELLARVLDLARADPHPNIRGYCADVLGTFDDPRIPPLLMEMARAETWPGPRRSALVGLGRLECAEARPLLIEALGDADVRGYAAQALGLLGDPAAFEPVLEAWRAHPGDALLAEMAPRALAALDEVRAVALLLDRFEEAEGRHALVELLRERPGPAVRDRMIRLLPSPDESLRRAAVRVLGAAGDASCVEPLLRQLRDEPGDRAALADALAEIGDARAARPLAEVLRAEEDPVVKVVLAGALADLGVPRAIPDLMALVDDAAVTSQPMEASFIRTWPWNLRVGAAALWAVRTLVDGREPFPRNDLTGFPEPPASPWESAERALRKAWWREHEGDADLRWGVALPAGSPFVWPWPLGGDLARACSDGGRYAWIVGSYGQVARLDWRAALADPGDATAWRVFDLGPEAYLTAVWARGGSVWIGGRRDGPLLLRLEDGAWRDAGGARLSGTVTDILGFGEDDVRIATSGGAGAGSPPETWCFDGERLTRLPSGDLDLRTLYRLCGPGPDRLFATGWADDASRVLRWTAGGWTKLPAPAANRPMPINPVGRRGETVYAASHDGLVLEIGPGGPRALPVPDREIQDLAADGEGVYVATYRGAVLRWDGERWARPERWPPVAGAGSGLPGLHLCSLADGVLLAVGSNGFVSVLDGEGRHDLSRGWDRPVERAWSRPGADLALAAGPGGACVLYDGAEVREIPLPLDRWSEAACALFARSADEVYAAGPDGRVYRHDGRRWIRLSPRPLAETPPDLPAPGIVGSLWARGPEEVWAAAAGAGGVFRYDPAGWTLVRLPIEPEWVPDGTAMVGHWRYPSIGPVWPDGPDAVWIGTEQGFFRFDGATLAKGTPDAAALALRDSLHGVGPIRLERMGLDRALRR